MSAAGRKTSPAELVLLPSLKNCLLNLPASLVSVLINANTVAQNVVVELSYRSSADGKSASSKSVFAGWTGMQSHTKAGTLVSREGGIAGSRGIEARRDLQDIPTVEMDAAFGRLLGLTTGMRTEVKLHVDPPQAHTVNIEPATATDWEIIELHARFLEMNFLSQVRALPNASAGQSHPLALHLTPTSTANVLVTSLTPSLPSSQPFAKISPDAEVIVAPKTRQSQRQNSTRDSRSVTSRHSAGGRSARSARHRSGHDEDRLRPPLFLRGIARAVAEEWFDERDESGKDDGLKVWVDREHLLSRTLKGVTWITVSLIKPAGLQEPIDPQQASPDHQPASKLVAKLCPWDDAPEITHAAISSLLCATLGAEGVVGGILRVEPAPSPLPRTASAMKEPSQQASKDAIIKRLRVTPFIARAPVKKEATAVKFGGESKAEKEESAQRLRGLFGKTIFDGPITDGMLLPAQDGWPGGILDLDPPPPGDPSKSRLSWLQGADRKLDIIVQAETPPPQLPPALGESLPEEPPQMVGIDSLVSSLRQALLRGSCALLTGGLGSGKTNLTHLLAHQLRSDHLFHTMYFPCRSLVNEDTRIKTIKDTLSRIYADAAWGCRLGGRALIILDDLDSLCPVEQELQMDANGRSKQVSELLCSLSREYCGRDSGVVLIATAQSKEGLNNVVVAGHMVRDIVALKAPDKEGRRRVLAMLVQNIVDKSGTPKHSPTDINEKRESVKSEWMEGSDDEDEDDARPSLSNQSENEVEIDPDLDLLDIAGQTDGYMPGDLALLVSRARSEALIRAVSEQAISDTVSLGALDFEAALKGFTPASLRGVTLQHSTTTFAAIGGLKHTRQTLLETLQYPTTYAPLFAKCPLRLRSGLLLYGYPGCGKTLLASAVAGECGLNFISVKGPEILNKYIGASEKSVRDLFERAEAAKPCVLFFDEFDSIAPKRGHDSTGVTDRVVNMLLTMMDGAEGLSGVYVLAATSRPDLIDPALLRPGRLDKSLECGMPDIEDRFDILRAVASKGLRLDDALLNGNGNRSLYQVARRTEGYSGADLQAVIYNAHLQAIHDLLGPGDVTTQNSKARQPTRQNGTTGNKTDEFTFFRLGDAKDGQSSAGGAASLAAHAAERAQIASSLASMQLARKNARQVRHASFDSRPGSSYGGSVNGISRSGKSDEQDPIIQWHHLETSLRETRSSISAQERRRLEKIYREFIVGRSGELGDGSATTEIGGRTSLM